MSAEEVTQKETFLNNTAIVEPNAYFTKKKLNNNTTIRKN